jgi:hypothetical protein
MFDGETIQPVPGSALRKRVDFAADFNWGAESFGGMTAAEEFHAIIRL